MIRKTLIVAAAMGLALSMAAGGAAAKGKCVKAGGQGTGLGADIAKNLAKIALGQSLSKSGHKAKGKISYTCDNNPLITTCTASQRACK